MLADVWRHGDGSGVGTYGSPTFTGGGGSVPPATPVDGSGMAPCGPGLTDVRAPCPLGTFSTGSGCDASEASRGLAPMLTHLLPVLWAGGAILWALGRGAR